MKHLIREICAVLGEPEPHEIERKFLIEMPDINFLNSLPNCKSLSIIQTYLKSAQNEESRIRQRGKYGNFIYKLTTKKTISPVERVEFEKTTSRKIKRHLVK